jgi:hypothetical protein
VIGNGISIETHQITNHSIASGSRAFLQAFFEKAVEKVAI